VEPPPAEEEEEEKKVETNSNQSIIHPPPVPEDLQPLLYSWYWAGYNAALWEMKNKKK
jgi:hypothetical protein